ncbi:hypothetical protein [Synechococcus sp. CCY 0621]|uniref:hypothetical protein n=1 Tax=Synechococcus sp. CCY 0621 TaxID=2815603 RepID=UPI001C226D02|nr:hypothetical protein [Synechococcus sp. CCY 0621]
MSRLKRELACRRRLTDGSGERWLWALGSSLPWVGLAVLLLHALTRRTVTPFLYGLTALGAVGFLVLTLGGLPDDLANRNRLPSGTVPAAITLVCVSAFAFGHRQGQEKAAVEARKWLELDR